MEDLDLIFDLYLRNDRQGPGSDDETRRAIDLARLHPGRQLAIADIGCGTGASTLVLAESLDAQITAVDFAEPFIRRLRKRAADRGVADRVDTGIADMATLPFHEDQFDVIWSEGAIYNIGFAEGLRAWRRFLKPGGVVAVTELTWTTARRPAEVDAHWNREYPGIGTTAEKLRAVELEGYEPLGAFLLPRECWEANFYDQLVAGFGPFLERHGHAPAASELVAAAEEEVAMFQSHGRWYTYGFYIARKPRDPVS